jgi:hypothetical protein
MQQTTSDSSIRTQAKVNGSIVKQFTRGNTNRTSVVKEHTLSSTLLNKCNSLLEWNYSRPILTRLAAILYALYPVDN